MEKLTKVQRKLLEAIDAEIEGIEEKLAPYQKYIAELNRLKATRRVLLDERRSTSGGGGKGSKLSMEEVIQYLRDNGPSSAIEIAEGLSVESNVVRAHLSRHKDTRYEQGPDKDWWLIGEPLPKDEDEEEEEEEDD